MGRGRGTRTVRSALLLAALALLPATAAPAASAPAPPPPSDPAARSWHQEGADAARTSTVDVEPLAAEPEIAWKFPLPGGLLAGPVNWEGTVFVLAGPARSARLLAVDATTGGILAKREGIALKGGRPWLAAWNGSTVLVDADRTLLLHLRGARFEAGRAPEVPSACPPVLSRGVLYAASGTSFQSLHLETGRVLSSVDHHLTVRPPVALALSGGLLAGVNYRLEGGYDSPFVFASRTAVSADGVLGEAAALRYCQVNNRAPPDRPWLSILEEGEGSPALAVTAPSAFLGMESAESTLIVPGPRFSEKDARIATLAHPGVPWKGSLLGISSDGELLSVTGSGRYSVLMEKGSLPRGARPGPAAAARGVAFFGNWALDLASKRVLWTLPDLDPVTALQPAGDGRLVAVTKDGTLVGLAAKGAKAAAAPGGTAAAAGPAAAPAAPPTGADGLLLLDGTEIPGPFEQEGGSFLVGGAGGPPRSFPRAEVALATRGGKVVHLGSQGAVLDAWRRPLGAALAAALAEEAAALGREGAPAEARALLAEARAAGLPAARA
ncbi:MAG: PQQ-binding-like beta-propeller repeat protein, partial [Planctomycetes bacterium]|nr:PQQ-binding-like beta-propeller repeat protein [Planctomycetota bacterium]